MRLDARQDTGSDPAMIRLLRSAAVRTAPERSTRPASSFAPIVETLGPCGLRWMPEDDPDPHMLMWDLHRTVDLTVGRDHLRRVDLRSFDPGPSSAPG
jgi:hypothetical protein